MNHHKMGPKNLSRKRRVTRRTQTKALRLKLASLKKEMPSVKYLDYAYIPGIVDHIVYPAERRALGHFSYEGG